MKVKVTIIFILALIAGACSSRSYLAAVDDDLYYYPEKEPGAKNETASPRIADSNINVGGKMYAWQEYNVSPDDTIWFDDYLVVGSDTLLWEQVYGSGRKYAWQEYNVSPDDTIWFDDYLVVGSDTLLRENERKFEISVYGPGPEEFYWSDRLRRFHSHSPFDFFARHSDPLFVELFWRSTNGLTGGVVTEFYAPYISPSLSWVKVIRERERDTERPLYTYYMGLSPRFADTGTSRPDTRRGVELHVRIPFFSAILELFSR